MTELCDDSYYGCDNDYEFTDEEAARLNAEQESRDKAYAEERAAAAERLDEIGELIKAWDTKNAYTLCDYLNEFENICTLYNFDVIEEHIIRGIDLTDLPIADIEIDTTWENIYTVDVDGYVVYPTQSGWQAEKFDPEVDYTRK